MVPELFVNFNREPLGRHHFGGARFMCTNHFGSSPVEFMATFACSFFDSAEQVRNQAEEEDSPWGQSMEVCT